MKFLATAFLALISIQCLPTQGDPLIAAFDLAHKRGACQVNVGEVVPGEFRTARFVLPTSQKGEHCFPTTVNHVRVSQGGQLNDPAPPGLVVGTGSVVTGMVEATLFNASGESIPNVHVGLAWTCEGVPDY